MHERTIGAATHGRYLVELRESPGVLVGFHGYGESADEQFERLRALPGGEAWSRVAIQGLHRFYQRRTRQVVASWMTRQDRELAIADNAAYVAAVLREALEGRRPRVVVCVGFSQGVAMAFRAATALPDGVARHVAAIGGDVPPELDAARLGRLSSVLLCRGDEDPHYAPETFVSDARRLDDAGVACTSAPVPGAHEWSPGVAGALGAYLARVTAGPR